MNGSTKDDHDVRDDLHKERLMSRRFFPWKGIMVEELIFSSGDLIPGSEVRVCWARMPFEDTKVNDDRRGVWDNTVFHFRLLQDPSKALRPITVLEDLDPHWLNVARGKIASEFDKHWQLNEVQGAWRDDRAKDTLPPNPSRS